VIIWKQSLKTWMCFWYARASFISFCPAHVFNLPVTTKEQMFECCRNMYLKKSTNTMLSTA